VVPKLTTSFDEPDKACKNVNIWPQKNPFIPQGPRTPWFWPMGVPVVP
jgi:hypothetical protein